MWPLPPLPPPQEQRSAGSSAPSSTSADHASPPSSRRELRSRFRVAWLLTALAAMICASVCGGGCVTRSLLVPTGEPVRIRRPIRRAPVWVADPSGAEVPGTVDIPAGWYCLPDPGRDNE